MMFSKKKEENRGFHEVRALTKLPKNAKAISLYKAYLPMYKTQSLSKLAIFYCI